MLAQFHSSSVFAGSERNLDKGLCEFSFIIEYHDGWKTVQALIRRHLARYIIDTVAVDAVFSCHPSPDV